MFKIASCNEAYFTVAADFGMLKLTPDLSYGKDKLCRRRNLPGSFLAPSDKGDDLKFGNGGLSKGPAILAGSF